MTPMPMSAVIADLMQRLLRTESLITIFALAMFVTGKVSSVDEAVALATVTIPLVLGRSIAKATTKTTS